MQKTRRLEGPWQKVRCKAAHSLGRQRAALQISRPSYFPTACFARFISEPKAARSDTARSASAFRLTVTPDFFRPFMKAEYERPSLRTAALIRLIHSERNSRLRTRRSRNA